MQDRGHKGPQPENNPPNVHPGKTEKRFDSEEKEPAPVKTVAAMTMSRSGFQWNDI